MSLSFLPYIVYILLTIMSLLLFARMICWIIAMIVPPFADNVINRILASLTEPMIRPFRAVLPTINGIDIVSFIFASVFISVVRRMLQILANAQGFLF